MHRHHILALTTLLIAISAGPAAATRAIVPDDYPTIQAATDASPDTVWVRDGIYPERIDVGIPYGQLEHNFLLGGHPENTGRPRIDGIRIVHRARYQFEDLQFAGAIEILTFGSDSQTLAFRRCTMDDGLVHSLGDGSEMPFTFIVSDCRIGGDVRTIPGGSFVSDTLIGGGIVAYLSNAGLNVTRCSFSGPGFAAVSIIDGGKSGSLDLYDNSVTGYEFGVHTSLQEMEIDIGRNTFTRCTWAVYTESPGAIRWNRIEGCPGGGIQAAEGDVGPGLVIAENDIVDCGRGIWTRRYGPYYIWDNRVLRCRGRGIVADNQDSDYPVRVERNVVGRVSGDGIVVDGGTEGGWVRNNTSYLNGGNGLVVAAKVPVTVAGNIGYANNGVGAALDPGSPPPGGCNDWYANGRGSTAGVPPAASDLQIDPMFCDVAIDSVGLAHGSPLLDVPGCGLLGALGERCETSPALDVWTVLPTPCDPAGWSARVSGDASTAITDAFGHGSGCLELRASGPGAEAAFARSNLAAGLLATLTSLGIDLYRAASSTADPALAPVVRLRIDNGHASDRYSDLIWEPRFQDPAPFPTDAWSTHDLMPGRFWQLALDPPRTIDLHDRTLADWLQPGTVTDGDGDASCEIGPDARVIGYEIGIALEGPGTFAGAADRFRIGCSRPDSLFDFERTAALSIELTLAPGGDCGSVLAKARVLPSGVRGEVTFLDGAIPVGTATANIGEAWLTITGLTTGLHALTASLGPGDCARVSNLVAYEVPETPTRIVLTSIPNPAKLGDHVTVTARAAPVFATGTLELRDGATALGSAALVAGQARFVVTLDAGAHGLTSVYGGDGCHAGSVSEVLTQIVGEAPALSIADASVVERDSLATQMTFTIRLASPSTETVRVDYATRDGSATLADHDYAAASGTVVFPAGQTLEPINVTVFGDQRLEPPETFEVELSNPVVAQLGDAIATGTIVDDDLPTLTVDNATAAEGADTTEARINVRLSKSIDLEVRADYATEDVTARAGQDYLATTGTVVFAPGQVLRTIVVPVLPDSIHETPESFRMVMSAAHHASPLGPGTVALNDPNLPRVTIDDAGIDEGAAGIRTMSFRVHLSVLEGTATIRMEYGTLDQSAVHGVDFEPVEGVLEIPPLQREAFLQVPVIGDGSCEPDETLIMRLSRASNAILDDHLASGAIRDDDCATPVLVTLFQAAAVSEGVELRWRLAAGVTRATLERAPAAAGPWAVVEAEVREESGTIVAIDRGAAPDRPRWYRLVVESADGGRLEFGPLEVAARVTRFGLAVPSPNPSPGPTRIEFAVAAEGPVRLSVLDLQGREVAVLVQGTQRVGIHVAAWSGASDRGPAPPGLYFVRFQAAGRTWTRRLIVSR